MLSYHAFLVATGFGSELLMLLKAKGFCAIGFNSNTGADVVRANESIVFEKLEFVNFLFSTDE